MSSISGTVTQPVLLGTAGYSSTLTITMSGAVLPVTDGAAAVTAGPGLAGVLIDNMGLVTGGAQHARAAGGAGIQVSSAGTIMNSGTIAGGSNDGTAGAGTGGAGVVLDAAAQLSNTGTIVGGTAKFGGAGVDLSGVSSLVNSGLIQGGGNAGVGVALSQASTLVNHGTISGGARSGYGLDVGAGCTATNFGLIAGGAGTYQGGTGANVLSGGTLTNSGTITGGDGSESMHISFPGAAGVVVSGGMLVNSGLLQGYQSSYGGAGLTIGSGSAVNTGHITGYFVGAYIVGGSVVNSGQISSGGAGVVLSGGTLTTSGTITASAAGTIGVAVLVAPQDDTATLLVEAGATFGGTVYATATGISILELGGATAGTLGHLGTAFTGFDIIEVASYTSWTLKQANTVAADTSFLVNGALTVSGLLQDAGAISIRRTGELTVASGGAARAVTINLQGGTLAAGAGGRLAVGNNVGASPVGEITVDAGGTISGNGSIVASAGLVDNGIIIAQAAQNGLPGLAVQGPVSGTGVIDIDANSIANIGNLTVAKLAFVGHGGHLDLSASQPVTTQITGFGLGDEITLNGVSANTSSYAHGTLSLYNGTTLVDQLDLAGPYSSANFTLSTVSGYAITNINFVANAAGVPHASTHALHDAAAPEWHFAAAAFAR